MSYYEKLYTMPVSCVQLIFGINYKLFLIALTIYVSDYIYRICLIIGMQGTACGVHLGRDLA